MKFVENAASLNEDKRKIKSTSASCIKMTDQAQHLNGDVNSIKVTVNGNFSPKKLTASGRGHPNHNNSTDSDGSDSALGGGRLKFFKDGKFILELSHRKEGERTCWIPVPKKTYWPAVGTPRQESSTSLSVSDDNSSVQSSPWQRDHCWKQATPRRHVSSQLQFRLHLPHKSRHYEFCTRTQRRKSRRPGDSTPGKLMVKPPCPDAGRPSDACPGQANVTSSPGRAPPPPLKTERPRSLAALTHSLWERALKPDSPPRPEIVTLRKRILKELERVSLDDLGGSKRRARTSQVSSPTPGPPKPVSSHSITAILGTKEREGARTEDSGSPSFLRTLLRSPHSDSADSRPSSSSSRPPSVPHAPPPPLLYHPTPTPAPIPVSPVAYMPPLPYYPPAAYRTPGGAAAPIWSLYPGGPWHPLAQGLAGGVPWPGPPLSHSPLPLPLHRYIKQEDAGDVPLNLSKNAG